VKPPRDVSGVELARGLAHVGYVVTRQTGSHIRLTLADEPQHHVTIPAHQPLKIGTLAAVLGDVAQRLGLTRDELVARLSL
jgi:predicted RNA binding protein YcfA (HicA-like mRNA interferase family)